jgi:hypothetical protein
MVSTCPTTPSTGLVGAGGTVHVEAARDQLGHDALDVFLFGVLLHHDDHDISL